MKHLLALIALMAGVLANAAEPTQTITLEHTFNGYYFPYNFPVYTSADNDKYFYETVPTFNEATATFSTYTYNEDYSVRSHLEVTLKNMPANYVVSSVNYTPDFKLPDGTPVIVVNFSSSSISFGSPGYAKAIIYDAISGYPIATLSNTTYGVSVLNAVYNINGKASIIVIEMDRNLNTNITKYTTKIYSLGEIETPETEVAPVSVPAPYPVAAYDLAGHPVTNPQSQAPGVIIIRNSNGTTQKRLHR